MFGCLGCCVYPHGKCSILAMILGVTAYLFLSVAMWSCTFMRIDGYLYDEPPFVWPGSTKLQTSQIGLFSYQEFSAFASDPGSTEYICATYNRDQIRHFLDGPFRAARSFAVFANICIGAGALALVLTSCAYMDVWILHKCGYLFLVGSVLELLTFVVFASDSVGPAGDNEHNATFWWGAALALASSIVAFITGIVTMRIPPSSHEDDDDGNFGGTPRQQQSKNNTNDNTKPTMNHVVSEQPRSPKRTMRPGTETTTETILPDGRHKYTTTKWNHDGTTTVTDTIV